MELASGPPKQHGCIPSMIPTAMERYQNLDFAGTFLQLLPHRFFSACSFQHAGLQVQPGGPVQGFP